MTSMLKVLNNTTKLKLTEEGVVVGHFLLTASPIVAEIYSTLPLDWVMLDCEAAPISREQLVCSVQAFTGSDVSAFVRVQWLERHLIEHALDIGAHGVLVPKIESAAEAASVVASCFYPPKGNRGINPVRASAYFTNIREYLKSANERTLCMIQVESTQAVDRIEEIIAVDGIDVVFIGMGDLAASLGQAGDVTGPRIDAARRRVLEAVRAAGKIPGIFAYNLELARQYVEEGFRFVALGNDVKSLGEAVTSAVMMMREDAS